MSIGLAALLAARLAVFFDALHFLQSFRVFSNSAMSRQTLQVLQTLVLISNVLLQEVAMLYT
jgi:hypothetical protein